MQGALVALATQVSLALESCALTAELHRRASEARFRSLVQNAHDLIIEIHVDMNADATVRDARITQIYEGTNGVQAMDLLGRKIPEGGGRLAKRLFARVQQDIEAALASGDARVQGFAKPVAQAAGLLQKTTMGILGKAASNPEEIGAAAAEYLRMFGLVTTGWMWVRMATLAATREGAKAAPQKPGSLY